MITSNGAARAASRAARAASSRTPLSVSRQQTRRFTFRLTSPYASRRQQHFVRSIAVVVAICSGATVYQWYHGGGGIIRDGHAETRDEQRHEIPTPAQIVFEETRTPVGATKDETRDQISSQHLQVKKSWENPGVWCWGANDGKVAAPDAKDSIVRNPRWLPFFDGKLLRDLKLSREFGAAIDEEGNLLQWGVQFDKAGQNPVVTLEGKNLKELAISQDRILALSANGKVYSLSVSQEEQKLGPKPQETGWIPFWTSRSPISYRTIDPSGLGWNERVSSIAGGLEHVVLLTSKGRVYTAAAANDTFPTKGQLGVAGLTWFTRPAGPYDQPHEVVGLKDFRIRQVAAGDNHSVAVDGEGRVFAWGDNQRGQLGVGDTSKEAVMFDAPQLLPITKLYKGTSQAPRVTSVSAGGNTTFLTVDATRVASPQDDDMPPAQRERAIGRVTADTWACGHGIWGQLGNGRWTHVQALPTKILPLSGLFEYDERRRRAVPIRMRHISVGANHCAATMDNVTYLDASAATSHNDTNWGADVLFFGNNEFYQLGTGKRNNVVVPTYIQPLDRDAELREGKRQKQEEHRFHATPRSTVRVGGRWVSFEQAVYCGRGVTAVYSRC